MRDIAQRAAPLADRVSSAVLGKATSDEIAILIGEAERTRRVAEEDHAAARHWLSTLSPELTTRLRRSAKRTTGTLS